MAHANTAYMFEFDSIDGGKISLSEYKGNVILVVNTASECGFTSQYTGLQALWDEFKEDGLVVLGIPSNDFGGQEPGTDIQIKNFCEVNFDIDFIDLKPYFQGKTNLRGAPFCLGISFPYNPTAIKAKSLYASSSVILSV